MTKKINKIVLFFLIVACIIGCQGNVYALGFASAIGTVNFQFLPEQEFITSTNLINTAADYYDSCGYTETRRITDPSPTLLTSNMLAEVQLYCTHGMTDAIVFKGATSGITIGNSRTMTNGRELIGVLDIGRNCWNNNAKLITYMCCNTAGIDGEPDELALTMRTVIDGGANACLGFKDEISYSVAESWANAYNNRLANGSGVKTAARMASMFMYADDGIYNWYLAYDSLKTTEEQKIGTYSTGEINSISESYQEVMVNKINLLDEEIEITDSTNDFIISKIKEVDKKFDPNNYEIKRNTATIQDSNNNIKEEIEFAIARLKIGDFYTNAGYIFEIENDKVIGIYDNNIDLEKQYDALENIEQFKQVDSKVDVASYRMMTENEINETLINNEEKQVEEYKYFYDIKTGKKYIKFDVKSVIESEDGTEYIGVDTISQEIQ